MKNLVKDIKQNCGDMSIEGIVDFLNKRGDIKYTANYHREIYYFFIECLDCGFTIYEAKKITMELFQLNPNTYKNIRARFNGVIKSKWENSMKE